MSVAISWANKMQLAKCDIMVGFPISSHKLASILQQFILHKILYAHYLSKTPIMCEGLAI